MVEVPKEATECVLSVGGLVGGRAVNINAASLLTDLSCLEFLILIN